MNYLSKLQDLKDEKGLTYADIAELSGIPEQTVKRIFSGATPDPRFETIAKLTIALGGSLDVLSGLRNPDDPKIASPVRTALSSSAELIAEKDIRLKEKREIIDSLREELRRERRVRSIILIVVAAFVAAVMFMLIFDMMNGHVGYIRY